VLQTHPTERMQQANLLAQYELLQRLGGGERASVHLARDRVMQQRVAIKLFRDVWSRDPDRIAQLYGLARAAATLDGARIAAVYDHGTAWHAAFITNEYVPGRDLADLLPPGETLPPRRAATIVAQILEALMTTHAVGLVHGDLHPHNVRLRDESDMIALTDFGTASVFPLSDDDDHGPFRAPELSSAILTPMTDIYAVGALLRAMLPPVGQASGSSSGRAQVDGLRAVADRATAPSPAERYPTAATMRDALLAVTGPLVLPALPLTTVSAAAIAPTTTQEQPRRGTARRLRYGPLALAGAVVLGGIVGGSLLLREREAPPPAAPTALVAAGSSVMPSATVAPQPTAAIVAPSAAPQPTAAALVPSSPPQPTTAVSPTTATSAPIVVPSAAPTSVPTAIATVAPASPIIAAPVGTPTTGAAIPIASPVATQIMATPPAVAPTAVVPTVAPSIAYADTFGPSLLVGAYRRNDGILYGRQNAALYSVGTGYETGTLTFTVPQAPTGPLVLVLTGLDDEVAGKNRLLVTINGTTIFAGPDTFPDTPMSDHGVGGADRYWGEMEIAIPAELLHVGENTLVLENAAPGGKLGTPYILINSVRFTAPAAK